MNEEDEPVFDSIILIRKADRAMYNEVKQRGRDCVACYSQFKKQEEPVRSL